jgi:hypothetical protein
LVAAGATGMKTIKFIVGVAFGAVFALIAINGIAILRYRLYWSLTYSITVLIVSTSLSALCLFWAIRSGLKRSTHL